MALVDHFGNIVKTNNGSIARLSTVTPGVTISGTTEVTSVNGIYFFSEYKVIFDPSNDVEIKAESDAIDPTKQNDSQTSSSFHDQVKIKIELRAC